MLTLICGTAIPVARRAMYSAAAAGNVLFVVPDELTATTLARTVFGHGTTLVTNSLVITHDDLVQRLTASALSHARVVPPEVVRVIVRQLIDSDPASYDFLVGRNSVPYLSQGVLQRIVSAVEALAAKKSVTGAAEETTAPSPREKQLLLLLEKLDQRLSDRNFRYWDPAVLEVLSSITYDQWSVHFPGISEVVFTDFLSYSDITYRLVQAVTRHVDRCDVFLDFDPEQEQSASALESAYQRLYDMADILLLSSEDMAESAQSLHDGLAAGGTATVVTAATLSEECYSAAAIVRGLLDDALEDDLPSVVVALPNWKDYAPALEKEFKAFAIPAAWGELGHVIRSPDWLLLERLRDCCGRSVTATALSALLRASGFPALVDYKINAVEAWELASRLDFALSYTGQLSGWKSIIDGVQSLFDSLHSDRIERQGAEQEVAQDVQLITLIKLLQANMKKFDQRGIIRHWCRQTIALINSTPSSADVLSHEFKAAQKELLVKLAEFEQLVTEEPIHFSYFLKLFKTLCHGTACNNQPQFASARVTICGMADAGRMRASCCLVLGCNDGNLPQFARPDAAFLGYSFHTSQAVYRARQRVVLEHILRNHAEVLLFTAEHQGTEELLPSQFVEELLENGRCYSTTATKLLFTRKAPGEGAGQKLEEEFSQNLKGLILSTGEADRFAKRGQKILNIASNMSVLASRSQAELAGYDGVIMDPRLKEWLADWAERHVYSVSQLDIVVGCSFRFFADRILHLEEMDEADDLLPAHLFGSFTHDVLARFYSDWIAGGRGVPRPEEETVAREKLLDAFYIEHKKFPDASDFASDLLSFKLFGELGQQGFADSSRVLETVYDPGILGLFLRMEMARGGDPAMDYLKPANFEVGFGMRGLEDDDPLTLQDHVELELGEGEKIKLRGRIDRIDIASTGTYAVIDYKTGRVPEKREILGGFRTQLPVYTMVAEKLLTDKVDSPEPAGGLYYSLRKGHNVKVSGAFFRAAYQKLAGVPGRGLKDDEFHAVMETVRSRIRHSLKAIRQGFLTSTRHDPETICRYCPFEGFCYKNIERTEAFWQSIENEAEEAAADV